MFGMLFRIAMFAIGVMLLLDTVLPTLKETVQIDRHTTTNKRERDPQNHVSTNSTSYNLEFFGGQVHSCSIGYKAYTNVDDGDEVIVQASRVFKTCILITLKENAMVVYKYDFWRIFQMVGALISIACAFGWISSDRDAWWSRFR